MKWQLTGIKNYTLTNRSRLLLALIEVARNKTNYSKVPKVTNAKAGQSPHNYNPSFAFDIGFIGIDKNMDWNPKLFKNFGNIITSMSSVTDWGGNWKSFKDAPHFELKNWKTYLPTKK